MRLVRQTAADLMDIAVSLPRTEEAFEVKRTPYWVAAEATVSLAAGGAQTRFMDLRLAGQAVAKPGMPHRYAERVHAFQRRDQPLLMQRGNPLDQWQRRSEHILRSHAPRLAPLGEKIAQRPAGIRRAVLKHGWTHRRRV